MVRSLDISNPCSYERYWTSSWNETWKNIHGHTGFELMTSTIPLQRYTNWANKIFIYFQSLIRSCCVILCCKSHFLNFKQTQAIIRSFHDRNGTSYTEGKKSRWNKYFRVQWVHWKNVKITAVAILICIFKRSVFKMLCVYSKM